MFALEGKKNQSSESTGNDKWKADAFLNAYVLSEQKKEKKIGAIKLYKSRAEDDHLIDFLSSDPNGIAFLDKELIVKFTNVEDLGDDHFNLPIPPKKQKVVNDKWKADAYLNFYLKSFKGLDKKVGAIKLYRNKTNDRQVIDFLTADEGNLGILKSKLILKFTNLEDQEEDQLDL